MIRTSAATLIVLTLTAYTGANSPALVQTEAISRRIAASVQPARGERVLLRAVDAALAEATRRALESRGANVTLADASADLSAALRGATAYIVIAPDAFDAADDVVSGWLESPNHRQVIVNPTDARAIDIDYPALDTVMTLAMSRLRAGTTHVSTPSGTALQLRIGNRPFNRQDGDASAARAARAVIPADRRIRLPAGMLRVAPEETTVQGRLMIPEATFDAFTATDLHFYFQHARGRATEVRCCDRRTPMPDLATSAPFGVFVSRYTDGVPLGEVAIDFHPHRAGVVTVCVGDNAELGGTVKGAFGGPVRCFDLRHATVQSDAGVIIRNGKLQG